MKNKRLIGRIIRIFIISIVFISFITSLVLSDEFVPTPELNVKEDLRKFYVTYEPLPTPSPITSPSPTPSFSQEVKFEPDILDKFNEGDYVNIIIEIYDNEFDFEVDEDKYKEKLEEKKDDIMFILGDGFSFDFRNGIFKWVPLRTDAGKRFRIKFEVSDGYLTDNIEINIIINELPIVKFIRSDANMDARVDIADALNILGYLFLGKKMSCNDAGDVNDDGKLNIVDAQYLLNFLFLGGQRPKEPYPNAGIDNTEDELSCDGSSDGQGAGGSGGEVDSRITNADVQVIIEKIRKDKKIDGKIKTEMIKLLEKYKSVYPFL